MSVKADAFQLVPEDLMSIVIVYANWMVDEGFKLVPEPFDLEYPNTPVFRAEGSSRDVYYGEVSSYVNMKRAEDWARYGRACNGDTRYVVGLPENKHVPMKQLARLRELGVGVYTITETSVICICDPRDLSFKAEFPELSKKMKRKLKHARDLFTQGHWRDAFLEACRILETEARSYLIKSMRSGRVRFVNGKGVEVVHSESAVSRMTLGQLANAFALLERPTQVDSRVGEALKRINPNRVTGTHSGKLSLTEERKLRDDIGKQLIVIINAMDMLS